MKIQLLAILILVIFVASVLNVPNIEAKKWWEFWKKNKKPPIQLPPQPPIIQPLPVCTDSDFTYNGWTPEQCPSSGKQTRTWSKKINCIGSPSSFFLEQTCVYVQPTTQPNQNTGSISTNTDIGLNQQTPVQNSQSDTSTNQNTPINQQTQQNPTTTIQQVSTIDLKANGKDGPLVLVPGESLQLSWTGTSVSACVATYPNGMDSGVPNSNTPSSIGPNHPFYPPPLTGGTYTISCKGSDGSAVTDTVFVKSSPSDPNLPVCPVNDLVFTFSSFSECKSDGFKTRTYTKNPSVNCRVDENLLLLKEKCTYSPPKRECILDDTSGDLEYTFYPPTCPDNGIQWKSFVKKTGVDCELVSIGSHAITCTPPAKPHVCPQVCTSLYELSNDCRLNTCGNGCGADNIETFKTESECRKNLKPDNWEINPNNCVPNTGQKCTMEYDPVCGIDGKTYSNKCEAKKLCIEIKYTGKCKQTQLPTCTDADYVQSSFPVCSPNGKKTVTYTKNSNCQGDDRKTKEVDCTYTKPCEFSDFEPRIPEECPDSREKIISYVKKSGVSCDGGYTPSSYTQACIPTCKEKDFIYPEWSVCSSQGKQTRLISTIGPWACYGNPPTEGTITSIYAWTDGTTKFNGEKSCNPPIRSCTKDDWEYTISPSDCPSNGQQIKTYSKKSGVVCEGQKPADEIISCTIPSPVLVSNIPNQNWNEDSTQQINLKQFFSDISELSFSSSSVQNIQIQFSDGVATFIPDKDFNGQRTVVFTATNTKGKSTTSNQVYLTLNPLPEIQGSVVSTDSKISSDSSIVVSSIKNSTITSSSIDISSSQNSIIQHSTVKSSDILKSTLDNTKISNSFVDPSIVTRSTISASDIIDSDVTDSTITRSTIKNMIVRNGVVIDNAVQSGTITYNGEQYTGPISLSFIENPILDGSSISIQEDKLVFKNLQKVRVSDIIGQTFVQRTFQNRGGKWRIIGPFNDYNTNDGIIGTENGNLAYFDIDNFSLPDGKYVFEIKYSQDNVPPADGQWPHIKQTNSDIVKDIGNGKYRTVVEIRNKKPYFAASDNLPFRNENVLKDKIDEFDLKREGNKLIIKNKPNKIWYKNGLETKYDYIGKKIFFTGYHDGWKNLLPAQVDANGDIIVDVSAYPEGSIFAGNLVTEDNVWGALSGTDPKNIRIESSSVYLVFEKTPNGIAQTDKQVDKNNAFIRDRYWIEDNRVKIDNLRFVIDLYKNAFYKNGEFVPTGLGGREYKAAGYFDNWKRTKKLILNENKLILDLSSPNDPDGVYAFSIVTDREEWVGIADQNQKFIRREVETDGSVSHWIVVEKRNGNLIQFTGDKVPRNQFVVNPNDPIVIDDNLAEIRDGKLYIKNIDKSLVADVKSGTVYKKYEERGNPWRAVGHWNGYSTKTAIIGNKIGSDVEFDLEGKNFPDGIYTIEIKNSGDNEPATDGQWPAIKQFSGRILKNIGTGYRIVVEIKNKKPYYANTEYPPIRKDIIFSQPKEESTDVLNSLHAWFDDGKLLIKDWKDNKVFYKKDSFETYKTFEDKPGYYILRAQYNGWSATDGIKGTVQNDQLIFDLKGFGFPDGDYSLNLAFQGIDGSEQWFGVDTVESRIIKKLDAYRMAVRILGGAVYYLPDSGWNIRNDNIVKQKNQQSNSGSIPCNPLSVFNTCASSTGYNPITLYTDYDFFKWAHDKKYGPGVNFQGMTGEAGYRAYWADRKIADGSREEWMRNLFEYVKSYLSEYSPPTSPTNVAIGSGVYGPDGPPNMFSSSSVYGPISDTGISPMSSGSQPTQNTLETLYEWAMFLKPLGIPLEHPDLENRLNPLQESIINIFLNDFSIEYIGDLTKPPEKSDFEKAVAGKTILYGDGKPQYSIGMHKDMRYVTGWNGQYYIGVKGLLDSQDLTEDQGIYQIGSGVLNNFKSWAYYDYTNFNPNSYPDSWSNYVFISDETLNPQTKWTETELINLKTGRKAKIYHPTDASQKPFFIKGHTLDLYEYFQDSLGFPVSVTYEAPEKMKVETDKGYIEFVTTPCDGTNNHVLNCPREKINIHIPNELSDINIETDLSLIQQSSDISELFISYFPDIIIIAGGFLKIKSPRLIEDAQSAAKTRFMLTTKKTLEKTKQLGDELQKATELEFPGKIVVGDPKGMDSVIRHFDPALGKVFKTVDEYEDGLVAMDDLGRKTTLFNKNEISQLTKSEVKKRYKKYGFKLVEFKHVSRESGYEAIHAKFMKDGMKVELKFMTPNINRVVEHERTIGLYVGKYVKKILPNGKRELTPMGQIAQNYMKNVYEYQKQLDLGIRPSQIPQCPSLLLSRGECFKF